MSLPSLTHTLAVCALLGTTAAAQAPRKPVLATNRPSEGAPTTRPQALITPRPGPTDDRSLNGYSYACVADVRYRVKAKLVDFGEVTTALTYGMDDAAFTDHLVSAVLNNYGDPASMALGILQGYAQFFASSLNVRTRGYLVYFPVAGTYDITTRYKGASLVGPSNYMDLRRGDGTLVFHHDCEPGSDTDWHYRLTVPQGLYTVTVGVGSVSNMFYSAGTLKQVKLNHADYLEWTERRYVARGGGRLNELIPAVGGTAWVESNGSAYADSSILDGAITGLSHFEHSIFVDGYIEAVPVNEYLKNASGWPVQCITRPSTQTAASLVQGPVAAPDNSSNRWLLERHPDLTRLITLKGQPWPDPLYWNGEWIRLMDCDN